MLLGLIGFQLTATTIEMEALGVSGTIVALSGLPVRDDRINHDLEKLQSAMRAMLLYATDHPEPIPSPRAMAASLLKKIGNCSIP